ncbi:uncharacterized protein LOC117646165 isoform X2 [Thrips palmi]|nr:uncharacterized protein LOC117646165 isoform X2 [Thrips palmi]
MKKMKMKLTSIPKEILVDLQYNLIDVKLLQRNVLDKSDFILLNSYSTNQEKVEILMELMRNKTEEDHDNFLEIMEEDYKWLRDKCDLFFTKLRMDNLSKKPQEILPSSDPVVESEDTTTEENDRSSSPPAMKNPSSPDSTAVLTRCIKKETDFEKKINDASSKNLHTGSVSKKNDKASKINEQTFNQTITPEMMTIVRRNHRVVRKWSTLAHILGMTKIVHTLRMRMVMSGEDADACVLYLLEEWKGGQPKEATLGRLISALREEEFNDVADELEEKFALIDDSEQ